MDEALDLARARALAAGVRLLVLDLDGVLTDGGLIYDEAGRVSMRFDVRDGMGLKLAQAAGIKVAVISGLAHEAAKARINELRVDAAFFGRRDKRQPFLEICEKFAVDPSEAAFVGDDWVDASVMMLAGLPVAVADAQPEIKEIAAFVCESPGGRGAVRELVRFILEAKGELAQAWRGWLGED